VSNRTHRDVGARRAHRGRTAMVWVPLDEIRISARRRRCINRATVDQYRLWLEDGREAPPVRLVRDGDAYVVRDGRHRVAAALAAGHAVVKAVVQRIAGLARAATGAARPTRGLATSTWG
jgi:hypothetical protein